MNKLYISIYIYCTLSDLTCVYLQLQYKQEKADLISTSPTQFVMAANRTFDTNPYCS